MATTYPGTLDVFTNPNGTQTQDGPGATGHAGQHSNINDSMGSVQAVLGTTAGTSILKNFAAGDFPVRMTSAGTLQQTILGTMNQSTFGSPTITGGTIGTPTFVIGADATGDTWYKSAGGTISKLPIGNNGAFMTTNGTTPNWGSQFCTRTFNASGTAVGTFTSSAAIPGGSLVITNIANSARFHIFACVNTSHSTANNRYSMAIQVNGAQVGQLLYNSTNRTSSVGDSVISYLSVRTAGLSATSGTVQVFMSSIDAGSAYSGAYDLTVIETSA